MKSTFHLALPCVDITDTTHFYQNILGCSIGRSTEHWVDVDLFGHQTTFAQAGKYNFNCPEYIFEGSKLPSFHFGVIIEKQQWRNLFKRISFSSVEILEQNCFLKDKKGEHISFFVKDPNDYTLEFKCFKVQSDIYNNL